MTARVLIVDDIPTNVRLLEARLTAEYFEVRTASSGRDALAICDEGQTDIILLDVTRWLKEDDDLHKIPVIAVTAFAMKGDEERIREGGCEAYLSKPISVAKFLATVRQYLGDSRSA